MYKQLSSRSVTSYEDDIFEHKSTLVVGIVKSPREIISLYARGLAMPNLTPLPSDDDFKALPPYRDVNDMVQQSQDFVEQLSLAPPSSSSTTVQTSETASTTV